jgi:hypothetical protein
MIQAGQVTGARALQEIKRNSDYLSGKAPRIWSAEFLATLLADQLLLMNVDTSTALEESTQMLLELDDLFTIKRDQKYANRSRRWLYTRGYRSKQLRGYEMWRAFAMENPTGDLVNTFLNVAAPSLMGDYKELLDLPANSTKLAMIQAALNL